MTRLPEISERDGLPEDAREVYDAIAASRGRVGGPFAMLMHSPRVAGPAGELGHYLRFESGLPAAVRELVTITAAREMDCAFEWGAHAPLALEAGVSQETIDVVAHREDAAALPEDEAALVRYARELLREHRVADATFAALRSRFDEQEIIELTAIVGYYGLIASVINAMEIAPREGAPALP